VLQKAIRQAAKAPSFREASADLADLLQVTLSPSHLGKLAGRIGTEWATARDADVQAFQGGLGKVQHAEAPQAAVVMVDGGTLQTRAADQGRGVQGEGWREFKAACLQTLSSQASAVDPQPEPPPKFLDPPRVARLAAEIKGRRQPSKQRAAKGTAKPTKRRRRRARKKGPRKLVRTVLASMARSDAFGWQVAVEVHRRGLHRARRKGYVCDGQKYNWTLYEMHLVMLGFIGILDFIHLLSYLYGAAQALEGKGTTEAWACYERWLRWAWAGQVRPLLADLKAGSTRLGEPPRGCAEDDPRRVLAEAYGYVRNNRVRMDYPRYRQLGLPISSAPVESTIKQLNRRVKGTEKFWLEGGAEALLQLRAAHLSEDDTAQRYWERPRPYARAVGAKRLRPAS
jgi:hypothetical protein